MCMGLQNDLQVSEIHSFNPQINQTTTIFLFTSPFFNSLQTPLFIVCVYLPMYSALNDTN